MLTATLLLSGVTLIATIAHMRNEARQVPISVDELWKIRGYQEDLAKRRLR